MASANSHQSRSFFSVFKSKKMKKKPKVLRVPVTCARGFIISDYVVQSFALLLFRTVLVVVVLPFLYENFYRNKMLEIHIIINFCFFRMFAYRL
jgi:hypothetical protein